VDSDTTGEETQGLARKDKVAERPAVDSASCDWPTGNEAERKLADAGLTKPFDLDGFIHSLEGLLNLQAYTSKGTSSPDPERGAQSNGFDQGPNRRSVAN
jgi:hypothetical protein